MLSTIAALGTEALLAPAEAESPGFEAVYRRFGHALFGTALRMLRRREDAEDAVQDAFLTLHRSPPGLTEDESGAWLHRVVVNRCLDRLRRGRRWRTTEIDESTRFAPGGPEALGLDLESAVARLPQKARLVFLLHDVEGFRHRELSEMLDLSEGTTKSQLSRARRMLRESMRGTP